MAYCTVAQVEADFKDTTFTTTSNVKTADVTQFIIEADALINAYVGMKYTVPVTAGEGLELLKFLSRSLVSGRIKKITEVKNEKATEVNQSIVGVLLSPTKVMEILKKISEGEMTLVGASELLSNNGFYSNNVAEEVEGVIEKDTKQW